MDQGEWLAQRFEEQRANLQAVAYRMLGSLSEAEDAVQESWLRLSRAGVSDVENLAGWLRTVVARVCLDMLRSRESRREEPLPEHEDVPGHRGGRPNPEQEALLADSVGLALLVVLEKLAPAERVAFVLHDMFAVPFEEIAPIVGRSPGAARQLASRARRRVQGPPRAPAAELRRQREVVDAFLAAIRQGDFDALVALLDPDVVLHTDSAVPGGAGELRGAVAVAKRGVRAGASAAQPALVDGTVGVIVAPRGRLKLVLRFTLRNGKIAEVDAVAEPERLAPLDLSTFETRLDPAPRGGHLPSPQH